jgi:hypothetical protein
MGSRLHRRSGIGSVGNACPRWRALPQVCPEPLLQKNSAGKCVRAKLYRNSALAHSLPLHNAIAKVENGERSRDARLHLITNSDHILKGESLRSGKENADL